jgi:L-threonylcarbamoyladenylate synthase
MKVVTVDPRAVSCSDRLIVQAAEVLRAGGLVAFPTETVYGLGASALDAAAVARIFAAKGRPANNPLIVHVAEASEARPLVPDWPDTAARLAERFWPGPLTLVLPRANCVPDVVTAGGPTVAVRVPSHPVAQALLRAAGVPVAAPSANRSNRLSPTTAAHVLRDLEGRIDLVLDGGPAGSIESTVLDLTTAPPRLLRPGTILPAELEAVVGPIAWAGGARSGSAALPSPGMMPRHYAPRTPTTCVEGDGTEVVRRLRAAGLKVGWVTMRAPADRFGAVSVVLGEEPARYAAALYAALHELDERALDRIVVALPPDRDEWLGVRDRLRRASHVPD